MTTNIVGYPADLGHILLIEERDRLVAELAETQNGYAIRNDEVTGLLGIERALRARVLDLEAQLAFVTKDRDSLLATKTSSIHEVAEDHLRYFRNRVF